MGEHIRYAGPSGRFRRLPALPILLLLCAMLLSACATQASRDKDRLQVATSIEPLAFFIQRIGGEHVSVTVMVPPGGDPHSYEPTPRQMAGLSSAALFVKAGSGVEFELDWMPRLLDLNKAMAVCDASSGVRLLQMSPESEHEEHGRDGHHHGRYDPHFWLSPANARLIAANVARSLAAVDPANRTMYEHNLALLDRDLQALDGELRRTFSGMAGRRFIVFHPAWGYFAHDYGLEQVAIEQEGKTVTPVQMERVIRIARASGIRTVFVSPQFSTAQADAVAQDIGGSSARLDPLSRDYLNNLRQAAAAISGGAK